MPGSAGNVLVEAAPEVRRKMALFAELAADYRAVVGRVAVGEVAPAVARVLTQRAAGAP